MHGFPLAAAAAGFIAGEAPVNTVAPVASGTPTVGEVLTVTDGTWTGTPAPFAFSYQWLLDGVPIVGENANSYLIVPGDVGGMLSCEVTASNGILPDGHADSNALGPVIPALVPLTSMFVQDTTARTTTSTAYVEVPSLTITHADFVAAGFSDGDNIALIMSTGVINENVNNDSYVRPAIGATFAGATPIANAEGIIQPSAVFSAAGVGSEYNMVHRFTLAATNNFYVGIRRGSTLAAAGIKNTSLFFFNADELGNGFAYASATPGSNAPAAFADQASVTLAESGNWLCFGYMSYDYQNTTGIGESRTRLNAANLTPVQTRGASTGNLAGKVSMAFGAAASGNSIAVQCQSAGVILMLAAKIMAINLDRFGTAAAVQSANALAAGALNTFVEYGELLGFELDVPDNVLMMGLPAGLSNQSHAIKSNMEVDGSVTHQQDVYSRQFSTSTLHGGIIGMGLNALDENPHDLEFNFAEGITAAGSSVPVQCVAAFGLSLKA